MWRVHLTFMAKTRIVKTPASIGVLLTMENDMSHYTLVSGALVALALGTMVSPSNADMHYGPRQVNGQCYVASGPNNIGYWAACEDRTSTAARTGGTANARIARPSAKKKSSQQQ
jgi:hypothetical protein